MSIRHRLQNREPEPIPEVSGGNGPELPAAGPWVDVETVDVTEEPAGPQQSSGPASSGRTWLRSEPTWVLPLLLLNVAAVLAGCAITLMALIPVGWYALVAGVVGILLVISTLVVIRAPEVNWPTPKQDRT
jgi:hypothetical protein